MQASEHRIAVYDAGFGGISWPVEYGGLGLTADHQEAFTEEVAKYPQLAVGDLVTGGICAPTLLDFGSEEQKRRYIPHMLRGDEAWTQLLSEPAGSDLAGLQTRAVLDGDDGSSMARRSGRRRAGERPRSSSHAPTPMSEASGPVDVHRRLEGSGRHHPAAEADDRQ
jgi:hypothetical protein